MKCNRLTQLLMTVLIISLGALTACGSEAVTNTSSPSTTSAPTATAAATAPSALPGKLKVVTTSNIIADWVRAVGGDRVEVLPLLPANADPHTFQPGARDVSHVADADLVLSVGLSLEARWLNDLVRNAASDSAKIVPLGDVVDPIEFMEIFEEHGDESEEGAGEEHGDEHGHEHGELDPHFWFDPQRVKQAVNAVSVPPRNGGPGKPDRIPEQRRRLQPGTGCPPRLDRGAGGDASGGTPPAGHVPR